jgi:biuret amidohydrolase
LIGQPIRFRDRTATGPTSTRHVVKAASRVVLPRDAVAGVPAEYGNAVIDNTLSLLATVTTTDHLLEAWKQS